MGSINLGSNGTITNLAVGGIPDNTIDNGTMADDSIGIAELSATGTAGNTTYLRGDNAWVVPPDTQGKILGYAYTSNTTGTNCSAFTGFTTISGFALNYTPTASNSKLLFYATLHLTVRSTNSSYYGNMEVRFKHGSHATTETVSIYQGTGSGTSTAFTWPATFVQQFDAVDTNARDIEVEIHNASAIAGGDNNGHQYINEYSGRSTMSLIEVAA